MSIYKARKFYRELTHQQKHFVDNKTINTTMSVKHWIAFLKKASDYDEYADKARTRLTQYIVLLCMGLIASGIVAFNLYDADNIYNNYAIVVSALIVVLIIRAAQIRSDFSRRDINNYLRLFFMPFLDVINSKAGEEARLSASLDLRDPFKGIKPERADYERGGRKRKVQLYEHKVIVAGVTLSDNSHLETALVDEIRKISYRNANGKSKSKSKTLHRVFIRLSANKQVYKLRKTAVPGNVEFTEDENHFIFKLKEKHKEQVYSILNLATFFSWLGKLYAMVEPVSAQDGTAAQIQSIEGLPTEPGVVGQKLAQAVIWDDLIFDRYDYDSVTRQGSGFKRTGESKNVFDS